MREILTVPNPILREKSEPIDKITPKIRALAEELEEHLGEVTDDVNLIGLAAPELGVLVRMFAYDVNPYSSIHQTRVVVNPVICSGRKYVVLRETCLSVPGKDFTVRRYSSIRIKCTDIDGKYRSFKESGIIAQMFQHEIDHLDGICIDVSGEEIKKEVR